MKKETLNLIETFIKNNELDFNDTDSALNFNCCVISGYALHLNIDNFDDLILLFDVTSLSSNTVTELKKVFEFAKGKNYGEWWTTDDAKELYHF